MSKDNPQAEGEVGHENVGASDWQTRKPGGPPPITPFGNPSELRTEDALAKSDEELRRLAVARLAEHLDIGSSLVTHCEEMAQVKRGDRLGPLYAAARLMRANAQVAKALAQVALLESRHRSIVERVQSPDPKTAELNCSLQSRGEGASEEEQSETNLKVWRRLQEIVVEAIRFRAGESGARDVLGDLIRFEEEKLAHIRSERVRPS